MTIFDYISERPSIGDLVELTKPRNNDIESLHYFDIYKGKKGKLVQIREKGSETTFEVEFDGMLNGIFYESELRKI